MRSSWLEDNISSKAWFDVRRPFAGPNLCLAIAQMSLQVHISDLAWKARNALVFEAVSDLQLFFAKSLADEYLTNGFISESSRLMQPCWQHGPTKDVDKIIQDVLSKHNLVSTLVIPCDQIGVHPRTFEQSCEALPNPTCRWRQSGCIWWGRQRAGIQRCRQARHEVYVAWGRVPSLESPTFPE